MPSLHVTLPADLAQLATTDQPIDEFFGRLSKPIFDEFEIYNLKLVIQELCANIVKHAYAGAPGMISLSLSVSGEGDWIEIVTLDQGPNQYSAASWQTPQLEEPQEHGMGIWLMLQLMDEVHYKTTKGGNQWRLRKKIIPEAERISFPETRVSS